MYYWSWWDRWWRWVRMMWMCLLEIFFFLRSDNCFLGMWWSWIMFYDRKIIIDIVMGRCLVGSFKIFGSNFMLGFRGRSDIDVKFGIGVLSWVDNSEGDIVLFFIFWVCSREEKFWGRFCFKMFCFWRGFGVYGVEVRKEMWKKEWVWKRVLGIEGLLICVDVFWMYLL